MDTWLKETRFEDPSNEPDILEYDPETWKEVSLVKNKIEEAKTKEKPYDDFIEDFCK